MSSVKYDFTALEMTAHQTTHQLLCQSLEHYHRLRSHESVAQTSVDLAKNLTKRLVHAFQKGSVVDCVLQELR